MNKQKSIAIITARGGSKRIPRKNINIFCGKPIIAYSIEAALESGLFDIVMVSTEDDEIAQIAESYGAQVPFMRSAKTSDDYATTADVLAEVLRCYEEQQLKFDEVCCIYPTAPFVTAEKLKAAHQLLSKGDSVLTAVKFSFPPQRGLINNEGNLQWWMPEFKNARSQDLKPIFHDAGQFYFTSPQTILENGSVLGKNPCIFEVPETEVQDIDNPEDWKMAEIKYERIQNNE